MTRRLILSYVLLTAFVLLIVELPLALTYAGRANDRLLSDMERDARVLAGLVEERVEVGDVAAQRRIAEAAEEEFDRLRQFAREELRAPDRLIRPAEFCPARRP